MNTSENIINLKPQLRTKGFKNENFYLNKKYSNSDKLIHKKIKEVIKNISNYNLKEKNIEILKKIDNSYSNLFNNKLLKDDEFILSKHEIEEANRLDQKEYARYFIYRYKFNIYPKLKIIDDFPPCVQIEPTSICNYRCVMCYQADRTFSQKSNGYMGHMDLDFFKNLIDQLENNVEAITFASRGEPTLNKNFEKMLDYCSGKFLGLKMNTNASILNEKMIHSILSSDIQTIVFSIDSADKENYEKIRVNGNFDKVINNLKNFSKIKDTHYKDSNKIIRISGVKINSKQSIDEMKKQWSEIADIVAFTNYNPWESAYDNKINDIISPCTELWSRIFIWWDGKVNPCDYDYKSVLSKWNAKENSISDIWNSEYYNYLRYVHLNNLRKKINPCNRCINV